MDDPILDFTLRTRIQHKAVTYTDHGMKAHVFFEFFRDLMGTVAPPTPFINWLNLNPTRASLDEVAKLYHAIGQWPNNKSPGPDGQSREFYKAFADILSEDLLEVFKQVMTTNSQLDPLISSSYIVLILKKDNLQTPGDFRSISLLHGVQKIYSKVVSNRFQPRMQDIITDMQTGFQKNRQLMESYIYAQQVLHYTSKGKIPFGLIKVNIKKVFGTVS